MKQTIMFIKAMFFVSSAAFAQQMPDEPANFSQYASGEEQSLRDFVAEYFEEALEKQAEANECLDGISSILEIWETEIIDSMDLCYPGAGTLLPGFQPSLTKGHRDYVFQKTADLNMSSLNLISAELDVQNGDQDPPVAPHSRPFWYGSAAGRISIFKTDAQSIKTSCDNKTAAVAAAYLGWYNDLEEWLELNPFGACP